MDDNAELVSAAREAITARFGGPFSNISQMHRVQIERKGDDATFSEEIRVFLSLECKLFKESALFYKADGVETIDDYAELTSVIMNQLGMVSENDDDADDNHLFWYDMTVMETNSAEIFEDGVWKSMRFKPSHEGERCYAGVVFNKMLLVSAGQSGTLFFPRIVDPKVYYYPM
jgi:hypothetical protein